MTAGPRGPMLLQDFWFLEKLAHFDREVIPERRMHAKGSGANSLGLWQECPEAKEPPLELSGAAYNWNFHDDDKDYYTQPGNLFRLMSAQQQQVLFDNTAAELGSVDDQVRKRHIGNCLKADPAYGAGVAKALGIALDEVAE